MRVFSGAATAAIAEGSEFRDAKGVQVRLTFEPQGASEHLQVIGSAE